MDAVPLSRCPVLDPTATAPHEEAAGLRARGPAVRVELPGGVIAWSVTRYDVIRALTADPRVSRDPYRHWPGRAHVPEGWALRTVALQRSFVNAYGSQHHERRRRVSVSFSPRRVEAMRPRVQATAEALVDGMARLAPGERTDLRQALSRPLTVTVICDLFGVPEAMRERIAGGVDAILDTAASPERARANHAELQAGLIELLRHKRRHPGPDLVGDLLAPHGDAGPLPEQEVIDTLFLMLGAGFETAVNLITSAVHALLAHPRHVDLVRGGVIGWNDVIEETLRHEGPVMHLPLRYAVEDIDLGEGVLIRGGDPILLAFAAAGRDPAVHPTAPDEFDPTRADKRHLAFGHGTHFCLGAHLARLETDIALRTLFGRLPAVALADPGRSPARVASFMVNGPDELIVVPHPVTDRAG
ncbi:cytochrome P450 [Marinactinospora endophytica]